MSKTHVFKFQPGDMIKSTGEVKAPQDYARVIACEMSVYGAVYKLFWRDAPVTMSQFTLHRAELIEHFYEKE